MKHVYLFILFCLLLNNALSAHSKAKLFDKAAVVAAHPEASKVGVKILRNGGNAIDAAVAVYFSLAVVYPNAGNIGGGGFMVYRDANGEVASLDFREKAPLLAKEDMYWDADGTPITDLSVYGHLAAGVPGSVAGMVEAHIRYGKLDWHALIQPAIELAENGFRISALEAKGLNETKEKFLKYSTVKQMAFVKADKWKKGDILKQPELAQTLKLIAENGNDGFYRGKTADLIVSEMQRGGGIISHKDLLDYQAVWREPVKGNYKNYNVISMAPPSSGGIALLALLQSVEDYPLSQWGFQADSTVRLMVEAERRIYADRAKFLGDPDFFVVPVSSLLDAKNNKARIAAMNFSTATPSSEISAQNFVLKEKEQTTHFSIVDQDGNAVSITTTLNGSYGNYVVVGGAGFLLNNEMDDFSIKPGVPNMYGLVGGKANAIQPKKRMLSSMTPTIVEKEGKLFMVVGTPGGSTIITSVFQTILNVIEFGMDAQNAVSAPRFHHQWLPDVVREEEGAISSAIRKRLQESGYALHASPPIGRVACIVVRENRLEAGADHRGDDFADGY